MATYLKAVQYDRSRSLDGQGPPLRLLDKIPPSTLQYPNIVAFPAQNSSFLHKKNLQESRKAFLNIPTEDKENVITINEGRKAPMKKISFKIKKTSSFYRRTAPVHKITRVSELAKKFNSLGQDKQLVDRVNSTRSKLAERSVVSRKPSVKTKPVLPDKLKVIVKRTDSKVRVRAKMGYLESPQVAQKSEEPIRRPTSLALPEPPSGGSVRAAIEIFERRKSDSSPNTPQVPKPQPEEIIVDDEDKTDFVQIVNLPAVLPQRRCDSMYETLSRKVSPIMEMSEIAKSADSIPATAITPNPSFLWSIRKDQSPGSYSLNSDSSVIIKPAIPPKPTTPPKQRSPLREEKIYEELNHQDENDDYERYEIFMTEDDGYEVCASPEEENVYEALPLPPTLPRRQKDEPLPPRPPSRSSYCTIQNENSSNCYESIYNSETVSAIGDDGNYEYISDNESNRGSLVFSDQKTNSLYDRASLQYEWDDTNTIYNENNSTSDLSDDWVDLSDGADNDRKESRIMIIQEKHRVRKPVWRQRWTKSSHKSNPDQGSDEDHYYESLPSANNEFADDDFDSLDSDNESESRSNLGDSGVDIANNQLPDPPKTQSRGLTHFAAKLRRNWSRKKIDISNSLSRVTNRKSRTDLDANPTTPDPSPVSETPSEAGDTKSLPRKGFLNKFRRSIVLSAESASELTTSLENKPKSTFYLTDTVNIDEPKEIQLRKARSPVIRPHSPPPPTPTARMNKRATSWYADVNLVKNSEDGEKKRPNTCWYAEFEVYQASSTPSTSSAENSGTYTNTTIKSEDSYNDDQKEAYYNVKDSEIEYYNGSINGINNLSSEKPLRFEDEPLYQFYILKSDSDDTSSDFDSYYEVVDTISIRPSAMELVSPHKKHVSRTLWCEIPEVIQSTVLSSLSTDQKKLQEAKFEILTSEASYSNSVIVLIHHFIAKFLHHDMPSEEFDILFGQVSAVKRCSEKLLNDLEKCWQDNILLHGIGEIIQQHAEESFHVYVSYCANQILIDEALKKMKERPTFLELLNELEADTSCQGLSLYSFLMLPMQRITRWPLLLDAVLKRLAPQDSEYVACENALTTLNKIVKQCNEAARNKERHIELKKLSKQFEFSKGVPVVEIVQEDRWLVRSGVVTHMQQRSDEPKLTFGKRFIKSNLHLFLFNDILFVTKLKSENLYTIIHYCYRNFIVVSSTDILVSLPMKDSQGKHLLFLALLENQLEKNVEFLLSCNTETDKDQWVKALTPPRSENPEEVLYETWDCPQVTAVHNYLASQPDEMTLTKGDVIKVLKKMRDGWYLGERERDGLTGWIPSNYTVPITNLHSRSKNLKERYRVLTFTKNYCTK